MIRKKEIESKKIYNKKIQYQNTKIYQYCKIYFITVKNYQIEKRKMVYTMKNIILYLKHAEEQTKNVILYY